MARCARIAAAQLRISTRIRYTIGSSTQGSRTAIVYGQNLEEITIQICLLPTHATCGSTKQAYNAYSLTIRTSKIDRNRPSLISPIYRRYKVQLKNETKKIFKT